MSVFGVDIGTSSSVISVTRNGGVDIILNEVSKRDTASYVSLGEGEREIGERGLDRSVRNAANTISNLKRWIGMRADDPKLASEKRFIFCNTGSDEEGRLTFDVDYDGESVSMLPEQILAMYLQQLRSYVSKEVGSEVADCVLTVPAYYTAEQRRLVQQAAEISNINVMSLVNENAAASIDYGIFRGSSLPEKEEDATITAILDIGYGDATVSINKFWKGNMRVLGYAYDVDCGAREIDYCLYEHFAVEIQKKYKVDVKENKRSRVRLLQSCEKVKTMLSANKNAPLNIENLQDIDVAINTFDRDAMEATIAPYLDRFREMVLRAFKAANVEAGQVASVEMIGGGCRIPAMKAITEELFGKAPSFTLNATESVARGAAITAAVFSPKFQVREYVVNERCQIPIKLAYFSDKAANPIEIPFLPECNKAIAVLKEGDSYPKVLELTFDRDDSFTLFAFYDVAPEDANGHLARFAARPVIGKWTIGAHNKTTSGGTKIRIRFSQTGLVSIDSASAEELYEVDVVEEKKSEEDPEKTEKVTVKKEKKRNLSLTVTPFDILGHKGEFIVAARKTEAEMHQNDINIVKAKEAKNELESLILDNRSRLQDGGLLFDYATPEDREKFLKFANEYEEWLYDDGFQAPLAEYESRIKNIGPIALNALRRQRLSEDIPFHLKGFNDKIKAIRQTAVDKIGKAAHITEEELNEAAGKADAALKWGEEQLAAYQAAPKAQDPTFIPSAMDAKVKEIDAAVRVVVNKPAPPPPKKEEKKEEAPASPKAEGEAPATEEAAAAEGEAPAAEAPGQDGPAPQTDLD